MLLRYILAMLTQLVQTARCNLHHFLLALPGEVEPLSIMPRPPVGLGPRPSLLSARRPPVDLIPLFQLYWIQQTLTQIILSVILHKISSVNAMCMLLTNNGGPTVSATTLQNRNRLPARFWSIELRTGSAT